MVQNGDGGSPVMLTNPAHLSLEQMLQTADRRCQPPLDTLGTQRCGVNMFLKDRSNLVSVARPRLSAMRIGGKLFY